jgi:nucleotide-binding universal stress UspA family protein
MADPSAPILAAVDPLTLDLAPARFAALAAGHTGAPLLLAAVRAGDDAIDPLAAGQQGEELARDAEEPLERATTALAGEGGAPETLAVAATSAPRGLALAAEEVGAGLLVVGSPAAATAGRVGVGATAKRLLDGAPCAVAVVPRGWERPEAWSALAVGFVDTADGRAAVRAAQALAHRSGARLRVLSAVARPSWSDVTVADLRRDAEEAAEAAVSGRLGGPVDVDVEERHPVDALVAASTQADVLVCGARAYGPRPAALLGGVTSRVTREAACAVIVLAAGAAVELTAVVGDPD